MMEIAIGICLGAGVMLMAMFVLMWFTADNADARATAIIPLYLSFAPFGLAALLFFLHWLWS